MVRVATCLRSYLRLQCTLGRMTCSTRWRTCPCTCCCVRQRSRPCVSASGLVVIAVTTLRLMFKDPLITLTCTSRPPHSDRLSLPLRSGGGWPPTRFRWEAEIEARASSLDFGSAGIACRVACIIRQTRTRLASVMDETGLRHATLPPLCCSRAGWAPPTHPGPPAAHVGECH